MGSPPPPSFPSPADQDAALVDASFAPGPPAASLCGFVFPTFKFEISLNIPFPNIPFPPKFFFSFGLNCDLSNPFSFTGGVKFGGGRVSTADPDPVADTNV